MDSINQVSMRGQRRMAMLGIPLGILLGILFLGGCTPGLQNASMQLIDETEARWQQQPTQDYEISVEINRPGDRRRSTVIVAAGEIVRGEVSYWNSERRQWDEPYALNEDQSFPFTVPGLFEMVRGALKNSGRSSIRLRMAGEPPFPYRIVFGPVMMDGEAVSGTESEVTVETFWPR